MIIVFSFVLLTLAFIILLIAHMSLRREAKGLRLVNRGLRRENHKLMKRQSDATMQALASGFLGGAAKHVGDLFGEALRDSMRKTGDDKVLSASELNDSGDEEK